MRTCLALWNDLIVSCISRNPDKMTDDLFYSLLENNIVALFDGSTQNRNLLGLTQSLVTKSTVSYFDYELEARIALSTASTTSFLADHTIPINKQQLKILNKLRLRHLSVLTDDRIFWISLYHLYDKYTEFIDRNQIERVIFSEYPHTIYDYLFSLACINAEINCYALQFIGQLGRNYSYIIDMNHHTVLPSHNEPNNCSNGFLHFLNSNKKSLTNYSNTIQSLYTFSRNLTKREAKKLALQGDSGFAIWAEKQANALKTYTKYVNNDLNVLSTAYGIFYLQVEPESTVTPLSGFFSDQAAAITDFYGICIQRGLVPCIKEHPHQYQDLYPFSSNSHWQSHKFITAAKSSEFYNKLKQDLPHLNFLPIGLSPIDLLKDSNYILTGTLNGTIGLQSIFAGKEVIEYGLAWYQCHPLVSSRRYNDKSGKICTEKYSENPLLSTIPLENVNNIMLFMSTIVKSVNQSTCLI
jgi:hypothetical protein